MRVPARLAVLGLALLGATAAPALADSPRAQEAHPFEAIDDEPKSESGEAAKQGSPFDTAIHDLRERANELRSVGHVSRANRLDQRADRLERRVVQFRKLLGSDGSSPVIPRIDVRPGEDGKGRELVLSVESAQGRRELGVNPTDRRARVLVEESDGEVIEVKYRMAEGMAGLEKLRDAYETFREFGQKAAEPKERSTEPEKDPKPRRRSPRRVPRS
ncbi:MAG: hypothetical protein ACYS22_03595 [Planctomycetota bacterium]